MIWIERGMEQTAYLSSPTPDKSSHKGNVSPWRNTIRFFTENILGLSRWFSFASKTRLVYLKLYCLKIKRVFWHNHTRILHADGDKDTASDARNLNSTLHPTLESHGNSRPLPELTYQELSNTHVLTSWIVGMLRLKEL